jgi:hypothetical protein
MEDAKSVTKKQKQTCAEWEPFRWHDILPGVIGLRDREIPVCQKSPILHAMFVELVMVPLWFQIRPFHEPSLP